MQVGGAFASSPCPPSYGSQTSLGVAGDPIHEASGLAASRRNPGVYWTHNDSGDQNRIYALNSAAQHVGTFTIDGFASRDWEDIAVGPGPSAGVNYIYVGNIGDNSAVYDLKYIARFPEPSVASTTPPTTSTVFGAEIITFQYPDGRRDAETLMVDPWTKDIYIVSKRENQVNVYRAAYPQSTSSVITLEYVRTLPDVGWAVGGDISPAGDRIVIKKGSTVYHWCRGATQTVGQALSVTPVEVPYVQEQQGEAICWRADGNGYLTLSEGSDEQLYWYPESGDSISPALQILNAPGGTVVASEPVTILGTATDNVAVAGITFELQGATAGTGTCTIIDTALVATGSVWRFIDNGSNQGTAWRAPAFNDSGWVSGRGVLGYGNGTEQTIVSYGGNTTNKHITTYFRRAFTVADAALITNSLTLRVRRDDGVVVYLNGAEVMRDNLPTGTISHTTTALSTIDGSGETTYLSKLLSPSQLVTGTNVLAVEIHQKTRSSSDVVFDLELTHDDNSNWSIKDLPLNPGLTTLRVRAKDPAGNSATAQVSIAYSAGAPEVGFTVNSVDVKETTGSVALAVSRTGSTGTAASVLYRVEAGSAQPGLDFQVATGSVNFAAGQSNATIIVWVANDALMEVPETVIITLYDPSGCTLGTITQVVLRVSDEDTDNDTLSDDWERTYFGNLARGAAEDADNDGHTNAEEATAGTSPLSGNSVLEVPTATFSAGGLVLNWNSSDGRMYRLLCAPQLGAAPMVVADDIVATPPVNSFVIETLEGGLGFFSIEVITP